PECVIDCSNDLEKNKEIISTAIQNEKPDGIFASVERLALASYYVCYDLNLEIGKHIKILAFSSLEIAPLLNPALSTIIQPSLEMCTVAACLLLRYLGEPARNDLTPGVETIVLKSTLTPRQSTLV